MPPDPADFPHEVHVAFFIFGFLSDVWDGMSGTYMGKDWSPIEYFFSLYDVQEPQVILQIMKLYENTIMEHKAEEATKKRKAEERKSAGGGKQYTHNVKG